MVKLRLGYGSRVLLNYLGRYCSLSDEDLYAKDL